jgi:hypothetical protein
LGTLGLGEGIGKGRMANRVFNVFNGLSVTLWIAVEYFTKVHKEMSSIEHFLRVIIVLIIVMVLGKV